MKKTVTCLSIFAREAMAKLVLPVLFCVVFSGVAFSQGLDQWKEIGDFSQNVWKPAVGMDASMAQEHARMDLALTQVDIQDVDRAIYLSYKRMLDYTQIAIQSGKAVDVSIFESYEKVLDEAPTDKLLSPLPEGILVTFIPVLVEVLTEVPVPELSGQ
jgi:hypothetical protein